MNTKASLINMSPRQRLAGLLNALKLPLIAIVIGLAAGGIIIACSGINPFLAVLGLLKGGYGSVYLFFTTLTRATPIILAGLSSAMVWGSGYESLGMGGQMTMGALVAAVTATACPGPAPFVVLVSLLAGAAAGVAYSFVPTWLNQKFQVSLLIVTLMMNYVADNISSYFVTYVVKDPYGADSSALQTEEITAVLPKLLGRYSLHAGFLLTVLVVIGLYFLMNYTVFGYQARIGGLNPRFADYGGINSRKMAYLVLCLSAAIAGMAGAIEVLGVRHRFVDQMITSPGYPMSGVTASIMANYDPFGTMVSAIFLAGLTTGGSYIERNMGVPSEVSQVIQGVITMLVTIKIVLRLRKNRKQVGEGA